MHHRLRNTNYDNNNNSNNNEAIGFVWKKHHLVTNLHTTIANNITEILDKYQNSCQG